MTIEGKTGTHIRQKQKLPDNMMPMGNKPIQIYAYTLLVMFETHKEVIISVNHDKLPDAERLISLFKVHGVEQISRTKEKYHTQVTLARV